VTCRLVDFLQADVASRGGRLVVAVAPSPAQVYPAVWAENIGRRNPKGEGLDPSYPDRRLGEYCRRRGVGFIDLLTPLRERGRTDPYLYFPINLHWTAAGHAVAAAAIARGLGLSHTP